jgi:EAL domain-containing protein (putative c-di-GMP-specific phosphodiesterase class I)
LKRSPSGEARSVVEVTEHLAVEDLAKLAKAPMRFPQIAARLAVDDIGSGFAALAHILKLANRHLCSAGSRLKNYLS